MASVSQAVPVPPDLVLLSKGYGGGSALVQLSQTGRSPIQTTALWQDARTLKTKFSNVTLHDGFIYGLSDGILECVEAASGHRRWKRGRYGHGQVLGVDRWLLIQAESGEVALVEATPQHYREAARFVALEGKTWNNPCLAGSYLLVRNSQQAACYRLPLLASGLQ